MSVQQRVEKINEEIAGVASQYGVTSWERTFLDNIAERAGLTPKQEETLAGIEKKVFG